MAKKPNGARKPKKQTKRLIGGLDAAKPMGKPPKKAPGSKPEKPSTKPAKDLAKKAGKAPVPKAAEKPKAVEKELLPDQTDWQALYSKRVEIRALEVKESAAKAAHASAKKALDNANVELGQLLDDIVNPDKHTGVLPFKGTPAEKLSIAADKPVAVTDEAWKAERIEVLKLSEAIEEKLKAKGIHTLGDLSNAMARGEGWYRDVQGIGVGKAETIQDALTAYWASHKVTGVPAKPTEPDPATPAVKDVVADMLKQAEQAVAKEDKEWKTTKLASLKWPQGLRKKLKDAGIETLGALGTALASGVAIAGIGQAEMDELYQRWNDAVKEIRGEQAAATVPEKKGSEPDPKAFVAGTYLATPYNDSGHEVGFDTLEELRKYVFDQCGVSFDRMEANGDAIVFLLEEDGGDALMCTAKLVSAAVAKPEENERSPHDSGDSDEEGEGEEAD